MYQSQDTAGFHFITVINNRAENNIIIISKWNCQFKWPVLRSLVFFSAVINNWWEVPNQITSQMVHFYSDFQTCHHDGTWFPLFLLWNNKIIFMILKVHVFHLWKRLLFYTFRVLIMFQIFLLSLIHYTLQQLG